MEYVYICATCSPKEIRICIEFFKEFCGVFVWSYEEMPSIDSIIVEHEIKTYLNAKPVRKKIFPVNPQKVATIKAKVEKLLNVGFTTPSL